MSDETPLPISDEEPEIPLERPAKDWSFSQTQKICRQILGPMTKIDHVNGKDVVLNLYRNGVKFPIGWGDSFFDLIVNVFVKPMRNKQRLDQTLAEMKTAHASTENARNPEEE